MRTRSNVPMLLAGAILAVVAFVPRAASLDRALTIDERLWIDRTERFVEHVSHGDFSRAYETGHPGVTIMWIGGLAQKTLPEHATLPERYERARLALALADVALILLIAWLLAGLAGPLAGMCGGLLLALDPFLLAHNRVLHLDGILSLFMAASVLALLRGMRDTRWIAVSGALAGLAALTKQPSVFLLVATLTLVWGDGIVRRFALWAGFAGVTIFALYPALWVSPIHPLGLMLGTAARGASDSGSGGFFLGRPVGNPGPLFYPIVFALRTSVLTLPAALVTVVWVVRRRGEETRLARILLIFALGFAVMMTLGFKKGDRYLLPAIVAVDLAVATGAAVVLKGRERAAVATALVAGSVLHGGPALALHPYEEAHFNWAVGGPKVAVHAIVVGWGEGLDEAAMALAASPDAARTTIATTRVTQFADFYPGTTVRLEDSSLMNPAGPQPDLILFYISSVQSGRFDSLWQRYRNRTPVYTLEINGIPFVRVYRALAPQ